MTLTQFTEKRNEWQKQYALKNTWAAKIKESDGMTEFSYNLFSKRGKFPKWAY